MSNPFAHKSPEQIACMWQARVLRETTGKLRHILLQAMKNEYIGVTETSWQTLCRWCGCPYGPNVLPKLMGHARVEKSGQVTSMTIHNDYSFRRVSFYGSKENFVSDMRMVADALKLSDLERVEMFALLGRWITSDLRVGLHGEKLAS